MKIEVVVDKSNIGMSYRAKNRRWVHYFKDADEAIKIGDDLARIARGMKESCPECGATLVIVREYHDEHGCSMTYWPCSSCGYRREKFVGEQKDSVSNKARIDILVDAVKNLKKGHNATRSVINDYVDRIDRIDKRIDKTVEKVCFANINLGDWIKKIDDRLSDLEATIDSCVDVRCQDCVSAGGCALRPKVGDCNAFELRE